MDEESKSVIEGQEWGNEWVDYSENILSWPSLLKLYDTETSHTNPSINTEGKEL